MFTKVTVLKAKYHNVKVGKATKRIMKMKRGKAKMYFGGSFI